LIELPGGAPVNEGERLVVAALVEKLPDSYAVIPNVEIVEPAGQIYEIDVIVVAPHAVYVVETKDWHGTISGDAREWLVDGRSRRAPLALTERKAKVLKSKLVEHSPVLGRVWVEAVVVLAAKPADLRLAPEVQARVLSIGALAHFVADPGAIHRRPSEIVDLGQALVRAITGVTRGRAERLVFREYEVIEALEQHAEETIYLARRGAMPTLPPVRLRVVSLSPYRLTEQQRQERREALRREMYAQLLMGSHPNIVAARDVFDDEVRPVIVAVLDGTEGRTLRQRLREGTPLTVQERLDVLVDVCRALAHAHGHHIVHRRVEPESILIGDDGIARLGRFGLAKIQTPGLPTVWHDDTADEIDQHYLAPELLQPSLGDPGPATDLYGLGCVAYELFAGRPPFDSPLQAASGMPPLPDGVPGDLAGLLPDLLAGHPARRPADTKGVLHLLTSLRTSDQPRPATAPKDDYGPGDIIDGRFEVRAKLGSGGFSSVYRVYWAMEDREYALKVFNHNVPYDKVQREVRLLKQVSHPHIVRAVWADQTRAGQWYLVTELVPGETLEAYIGGAETKRLAVDEAVRAVGDVLAALEAIHPDTARIRELRAKKEREDLSYEEFQEFQTLQEEGIVHRDIKPQNLMLTPGAGVVLIDFNIASKVGQRVDTLSGTPRYVSPDIVPGVETWDVSPDLFAVGIVLYELVCQQHPFPDAQPRTDVLPRDPRDHRPDLAPGLADFLLRACAPYRDQRFATALEMRLALEAVDPLVVPDTTTGAVVGLPDRLAALLDGAEANVNPLVREFLALSSQARRSNRGTRGVDELTDVTYVETRLDAQLHRSVLDGRHRLVIITGNAGDGKTAFIQQVERAALRARAEVVERSANGMRLRYLGREIITLYDGSQDEADRSSDEVLASFLAPFAHGPGTSGSVRLAAINEGRLRDFLLVHRAAFPFLLYGVLATLDQPEAQPFGEEIVVVNLNLRSVTLGGSESIFSQQLQKIAAGPFWEPCQRCDHRTRCPIKHNVDTFRDPTSGPAATERLRTLVDLVRLRRRRHLTMRDVRSLIAHLLFRDRDCEEVPAVLACDDPIAIADLFYFQGPGGLGVPEGSTLERGAALLAEIDVALVANPEDDRAIARGGGPRTMAFPDRSAEAYPAELLAEARRRAGTGYDSQPALARRAHEAARRRVYFERADDGWPTMLPYKRLGEFLAGMHAVDPEDRDQLLGQVITAISMAEGMVDANKARLAVWLATRDDSSPDYRCFRRFPAAEFTLEAARLRIPYVETEPDRLALIHQPSGARLHLDVDLLEVLDRLREGYVPGQDEGQGILINLALFKQQLMAAPSKEILVMTHDRDRLLRIGVGHEPGRIVLSEVSP